MLQLRIRSTATHYIVEYDCVCSCHPKARVPRDLGAAGFEHCCCGRVHFAGPKARAELDAYLAHRRAEGKDEEVTYGIGETTLRLPDGQPIAVAYAEPQ